MNHTETLIHGKNPKLLLMSGMHGDEYEVIGCVRKSIAARKNTLPDFLFIPEASPSAVARHTRENDVGHDVNREFIDPPRDEEVSRLMDILLPHHFDVSISFHEDPVLRHTFYMYDSGSLAAPDLLTLRSRVVEVGAGLHTGVDDPWDADLGYHVHKGYVSIPHAPILSTSGFSWSWFHAHDITRRDLEIEIPGQAPLSLKQRLVDVIFDTMHIFGI